MVKFFLILSVFSLIFLHAHCTFTNGMSSISCSTSNCNMTNGCMCPSLTNPGNFALSDTPQFVTFTWDDAVQTNVNTNWFPSNFFWDGSIIDTLGCRPRPTFYVTTTQTDYGFVNLFSKYGLICDHSVTHTTNRSSSLDTFNYETQTSSDWIQEYSKMPYKVNCARAPFLETSDNYYQSLLDAEIEIDSSAFVIAQGNGSRWWPFTLDYGYPENDACSDEQCPSQGYSLWEIPMQHMYTRSGSAISDYWSDLMDPYVTESNYETVLSRFKLNFLENYQKSRAPMGLYIHYFWFLQNSYNWDFSISELDTVKVDFVNDYYSYAATFENVIFATEAMIVDWMKNPIKYSDIVADKNSNANSIFKCPDYTININDTCPPEYPLTTCTNSTDGTIFFSCGCQQVNYTVAEICPPIANCLQFNDDDCQCTSCSTGFEVSNGACTTCTISQCSSYSSGCTCSACSSNFALSISSNSCCQQISNCNQYDSYCQCTACSAGSSESNGVCITCSVSQCQSYSSGCTCSACSSGYQLSNNQCQACATISGCSTYTSNCQCETCEAGKVLSNNQCQTCSANNCATYTLNSCTCSACNSGFSLSNNQCVADCASISNCQTMDNDACTCQSCNSGYQLSNNQCQACTTISGCSSYTSTCQCVTCEAGKVLSNNQCQTCSVNNCATYTLNSCTCSACNSGFSLSNNQCVADCAQISNCQTMDNAACTCQSCNSGYQLSNNQCQACATISGCSSYGSNCQCLTCSPGKALSNNQCQTCSVANCAAYTSNTCTCSACNSGYSLSNGVCTAVANNCPSVANCYTVDSSTCKCSVCNPGYTLYSGTCIWYENLFDFHNVGFCQPKASESSDPWTYSNCNNCYQISINEDCKTTYGSPVSGVFDPMYCNGYTQYCKKRGYCKPLYSNIIPSCSSCQSCIDGDNSCPNGYTCSSDTYCTDNIKLCSTNHP